ncbi:hypothetical protein [Sinorhizobium fredii]|uniref:hypothetical protein n=1 Tax=Rhizobium fredii TaxID=380 RepID=UPI001FCA6010|nr:hypothetical protein [Sinorhizobium fredii]
MTTNGNGFDPLAQYARLSERVENQGKDIVDLRSNMNTGFQTVNSAIGTLSNELRNSSRTHWPVIFAALSVVITILAGLGFLSLQPIKDNTARLETAFVRLSESVVTQKEMEWRTARGAEDRKRTDDALIDLRNTTVSRNEWSERNHARDNEITDLGRRIDELRQEVGSVYGTRDVIVDLKREVDVLRRRVFEARTDARGLAE